MTESQKVLKGLVVKAADAGPAAIGELVIDLIQTLGMTCAVMPSGAYHEMILRAVEEQLRVSRSRFVEYNMEVGHVKEARKAGAQKG